MDAPAQTVQYFIAGYVVIFLGLLGYVFSLNYRWKKLMTEKELLIKG
jgi:CcmD family protein